MKKGKLNPDRFKVAGGAPVNQEDDKRQSPRRKTEQSQASNKSTESHAGKKVRGSVPRSASVPNNIQMSQKTGKRSGAQKSQNSRYDNAAMPASEKTAGAFGKE
jgi:hypothetical protein